MKQLIVKIEGRRVFKTAIDYHLLPSLEKVGRTIVKGQGSFWDGYRPLFSTGRDLYVLPIGHSLTR